MLAIIGTITGIFGAITGGLSTVKDVQEWRQNRGRVDLAVVLAQTTLRKWTLSEDEHHIRTGFPPFDTPLPSDTDDKPIRTAFTVLEFVITNHYKRILVIQSIAVELKAKERQYEIMRSHTPGLDYETKVGEGHCVFDLVTQEETNPRTPIALQPGEDFGRRIEFIIFSYRKGHGYYRDHVREEDVFEEAQVIIYTDQGQFSFDVPITVTEYRSIWEAPDFPESALTTWRKIKEDWWIPSDHLKFPRYLYAERPLIVPP